MTVGTAPRTVRSPGSTSWKRGRATQAGVTPAPRRAPESHRAPGAPASAIRPASWVSSTSRRTFLGRRPVPDAASAIAQCESLLAGGANLLDIGGESTRPGARRRRSRSSWHGFGPCSKPAGLPGHDAGRRSVDRYPARRGHALRTSTGVDIINDVSAPDRRRREHGGRGRDTAGSCSCTCRARRRR